MATLLGTDTFSLHDAVTDVPSDLSKLIGLSPAIDIIIYILKHKLELSGICNRVYYLKGRTGSGKSTLMISALYRALVFGTRTKLICSEPKIMLCKTNALDVLRYNTQWSLGREMGILTSIDKVRPKTPSMTYCTTQLLNMELVNILTIADPVAARNKLRGIKIIVVDEVHVLDIPMLDVLQTIRELLRKYGDTQECPMFIFSSATIDIPQMVKYFFHDTGIGVSNIMRNPFMIGYVKGSANFPVTEIFLDAEELRQYNDEESASKDSNQYASIVARYLYKNFIPTLDSSDSYIIHNNGVRIQCRDVLLFLPLISGIERAGEVLESLITTRSKIPFMRVVHETVMSDVVAWRDMHRKTKRILYIGLGSGYSSASDKLLEKAVDPDEEALEYETRIIGATPVIEAGKTISTLCLCIDLGISTAKLYVPLIYSPSVLDGTLIKQIPANLNQSIQRLGRIGRESPGTFVHFYSQDVMRRFREGDIPGTVNIPSLSNVYIQHFNGIPMGTVLDVANINNFLYPTSVDTLINTANDMIDSGFLTCFGQLTCLGISFDFGENWIVYARHLYYNRGYYLWEALVLASCNRKLIPPYFNLLELEPSRLMISLYKILHSEPTIDIVDGIQRARNVLTRILLSQDKSFIVIPGRIYNPNPVMPDVANKNMHNAHSHKMPSRSAPSHDKH